MFNCLNRFCIYYSSSIVIVSYIISLVLYLYIAPPSSFFIIIEVELNRLPLLDFPITINWYFLTKSILVLHLFLNILEVLWPNYYLGATIVSFLDHFFLYNFEILFFQDFLNIFVSFYLKLIYLILVHLQGVH